MDDLRDELMRELNERSFETFVEANQFTQEFMQRFNAAPCDDFCGISRDQMHGLLWQPYSSPELVTFSETPEAALETPIMRLFKLLVDGIGDEGLKPTAKGNLPRKLLQPSALAYWGEEVYNLNLQVSTIRVEEDFPEMQALRVVTELTGLIRKYKGKFILSRKLRAILAKQGLIGVYIELLRGYTSEYNWGYMDGYEKIEIIQLSFMYTLYLLHKFGDKPRNITFYQEMFLTAFPQVTSEVTQHTFRPPDEIAKHAYALRAIDRFAVFCGLAISDANGSFRDHAHVITKSPLLDELVRFTD